MWNKIKQNINNLKKIGNSAFAGCKNLSVIDISEFTQNELTNDVNTICQSGKKCFQDCGNNVTGSKYVIINDDGDTSSNW